jgi:hypothetical protein
MHWHDIRVAVLSGGVAAIAGGIFLRGFIQIEKIGKLADG